MRSATGVVMSEPLAWVLGVRPSLEAEKFDDAKVAAKRVVKYFATTSGAS